MTRTALFKSERLMGGDSMDRYPKISDAERLQRWIKRVHKNTRPADHGNPIRMELPLEIYREQHLPNAWVHLHADGTVIHISTNQTLGHAS